MRKLLVLVVLFFLLGFFSNDIYSSILSDGIPFNRITGDVVSPYDRIDDDQIKVYKDKIVIEVDNARWTSYTDTNSMDPLLDEDSNGLELVPESEDDIHVGDVVAYHSKVFDKLLVHRVVKIGKDEKGKFYILKGDNSRKTDPEKVRFSQIKYVLIGIIY